MKIPSMHLKTVNKTLLSFLALLLAFFGWPEFFYHLGFYLLRFPLLFIPLFWVTIFGISNPNSHPSKAGNGFVYLSFFLLGLFATWHFGLSNPCLLAGNIPISDAMGYLRDANLVAEGQRMTIFSSRRPLFANFLAGLLFIFDGNVKLAFLTITIINGLSAWLLVTQAKVSFGKGTAFTVALLSYIYYSRFFATSLTEQLGFPLGILASSLLLRGIALKSESNMSLGLFLLALGFNARAGAFFVLPLLFFWLFFSTPKKSFASTSKVACWWSLAIGAAFLLNKMIFKANADLTTVPFGNFSFTLYGLVSGGKGWWQTNIDFPLIYDHGELAAYRRVYQESWKLLLTKPHLTLLGCLKYVFDFFSPRGMGVFGFVPLDRYSDFRIWNALKYLTLLIQGGWVVLLLMGIYSCFKNRTEARFRFLLYFFIGIFLSIPFVPPFDADQMRAYAVTMPLTFVIAGIGLSALLSKLAHLREIPLTSTAPQFAIHLALLILGVMVLPIAIPKNAISDPPLCRLGTTPLVTKILPTNGFTLIADETEREHFISLRTHSLTQNQFQGGLRFMAYTYPQLAGQSAEFAPGTSIIPVFDLVTKTEKFLFILDEQWPKISMGKLGKFCIKEIPPTQSGRIPLFEIASLNF